MFSPLSELNATSTGSHTTSRRRKRSFAGVVAGSAAGLFPLPGLGNSTLVVRELVAALQPSIVQAPKENDTAVGGMLEEISSIHTQLERVEHKLKTIQSVGTGGPGEAFWQEFQLMKE
ncbi:hypothetical protein RhiLY_14429 [Ceratobasidium sp. AG-Ba]|nr:hypothetical protein RhiLY_14429 [Ceratobasidium sp. AG-Ba]